MVPLNIFALVVWLLEAKFGGIHRFNTARLSSGVSSRVELVETESKMVGVGSRLMSGCALRNCDGEEVVVSRVKVV